MIRAPFTAQRSSTLSSSASSASPPAPAFAGTRGTAWARRWLILAAVAASAVCVVLFVGNALRVGKLGEDIERLKKEQDKLAQQNEMYRAQIIKLETPERIQRIARARLGMTQSAAAPQTLRAEE